MHDPSGYEYWNDALKGRFGPVHDGDAQNGFYRRKRRDGGFDPVAIFVHEGVQIALVAGNAGDPAELWSWVCDKPVTEAAYHQAMEGKGWPDDPPAPVLRNISDDPHEALKQELAGEKEQAEEFLRQPITAKEQADQAAIWSKRIAGIGKKATDLHKVEKQPSLDEGRRVDDRWRDIREESDDYSKRLKRHLDAYLREEQRKEDERVRLAREEAARKQREHDEAAKAAAEKPDDPEAAADAQRKADEAAAALRETEKRNASAGRTGAKVALRTHTYAEITDFHLLLIGLKDRPEVKEVIESLANRAARSGVELPGMMIKQEQRAA
jgi:hypothetical protein